MRITVRQAVLQDVPRLLELYRLLDVGDDPQLGLEQARQRFLAIAATADHTVHVAQSDGRIVGTFALILIAGLAHGARPFAIVEDVVVDAPLQGRGVGRQMMRFAMDRCVERGCYKLALSSHLSRDQAHRFYESLGFAKHGFSYLVR